MMRLTFAVVVASAIGLSANATIAADLGPAFTVPQQSTEPVVELGSGWYLRGDGGWGNQEQARIFSDIPGSSSKTWSSWSGDLGAGYKFNEWFRVDLTVGESQKQKSNATGATNAVCPYNLGGLTSQGANPVELGYLWSSQAGTCNEKDSSKLSQADLLLNGYVDLGTWAAFTPYIGGGVGVARVHSQGEIGYYKTSDGTLYTADLSPTGTYPLLWVDPYGTTLSPQPTVPTSPGTPVNFSKQNWLRTFSKNRYNLAWALMGGVAYNINHNLAIDIGFRYLNNGTYKSLTGVNPNVVTKTLSTEEVRIGLRYLLD
jgi:opacity protein-like surface antigen